VRVDLVVLGLAAVHGLHRQGVAEHEGDALSGADIREPVPGEHALGRHDEILAVGGDDLEEGLRIRLDVPVHEHLADPVEDAEVHHVHVEIDSAVVAMLPVVESHLGPPLARMRT